MRVYVGAPGKIQRQKYSPRERLTLNIAMALSPMPKIQIKLEDGMIQAVDGLPPDFAIEVFDYDVEKYQPQHLSQDESGRACQIKEWHAPE